MAFPPKEGVVSRVYMDKAVGIDGKIVDIVDERVQLVKDLELRVDEIVEYRLLMQGPQKGKLNYIARKQKTVADQAEKAPPRDPQTRPGIYQGKSGQRISIQEGDMTHIYDADIDLLKKLSEPMCMIQKGLSVIVKFVDAGGKWVAKDIQPGPEGFKTGKEILQDNIDAARKEKEQTPVEKALANPNPAAEPEKGEFISDKDIQDIHRKAKKPAETKKPVPAAQPPKEPEKVEKTGDSVDSPALAEKPLPQQEDGIAKIVRETKERKEAAEIEQVKQMAVVPAPGDVPMQFDPAKIDLIKGMVAPNATKLEFELLMHLASAYHLDPLKKQIWCIKYGENPAAIFTGRDGFLQIAHRSGQFNGMESGAKEEHDDPEAKDKGKHFIGWCRVYRKDMEKPFYVEVDSREYDTKKANWLKMPRTMITKVAEAQCLRKAFSVSGLYSPEEMGQ